MDNTLQVPELEERSQQQQYTVHDIVEKNIQEANHKTKIVEDWMGIVNEVIEPPADVPPEHTVKKNGRPCTERDHGRWTP